MAQIYKVVPSKDETAQGLYDVICTRGNLVVCSGVSQEYAKADARERQRLYEEYEA